MSLAIIEINDCGLCCGLFHGDKQGQMFVSPGYALLTEHGITTGNAALEKAYLQPQQSFNQYWRQLNLSPLPSPTSQARHNADLAYAQLLQLHKESGSPEQIVFATPGSFDRDQLSVLLGLANAAPFKTIGLVDSAVAAVNQADLSLSKNTSPNHFLHLDIQLHQLVLTRLSVSNPFIERAAVEIITGTGLKTFYDTWARYIANQFIQQYRYDPLHTAEGEQQLYDSLPIWLEKVNGDQEIAVALDSPQGTYKLNLNRNDLLASSQPKVEQLQQKLNSFVGENDSLIASHRAALLPGLTMQLGMDQTLPANAAMMGCLENIESIVNKSGDIHFVTKLLISQNPDKEISDNIKEPSANINQEPLAGSNKEFSTSTNKEFSTSTNKESSTGSNKEPSAGINKKPESNPTHVLYQHRAQAIGNTLYIHQGEQGLSFSQQQPSDTKFFVENGQTYFQSEQTDLSSDPAIEHSSTPLQVGETITIGAHSLQLIEVTRG